MITRQRIIHRTGYRYPGPVVASYNEARLTPLTTPTQTTLEARVEVTPVASTYRYWDYWGTQVTAFDVWAPHEQLLVTARSLVETARGPVPAPTLDGGWDLLSRPEVLDHHAELLAQTPRTQPGEELAALVADVAAGLPPAEAARSVADWLREQIDYVPGATGVHTDARAAWEARKGVCQDLAHLAVGALRSLGLPARYVSGYLHPKADAEVGETVAGESHAWIDWWVGRWQSYDPTNGVPAGAQHVVVGRGRHYGDVPPLKGIYSGKPGSIFVTVEMTRLV